jgi:hypothetical protein
VERQPSGARHPGALTETCEPGVIAAPGSAGVDTVYLHIYDVEDLDHVRLLGSEVAARV